MRILLAFLFAACAAWGQTLTSTTYSGTSRTATHVKGVISSSASVYLRWATGVMTDCTTAVGGSVLRTPADTAGTAFQLLLTGLAPATKYYVAVCVQGTNAFVGGGDDPHSFTTTADVARPVYPTAPTSTGITGVTPAINGNTYTVGSACDDPTTGLQAHINTAAAVAGSANHEIVIPTTTTDCDGTYTLKNRTGTGRIIIHSDRWTRLPPDNARVIPTFDTQHMFQLRPVLNASAMNCESSSASKYTIIGADIMPAVGDSVSQFIMNIATCTDVVFDRVANISRLQTSRSARSFSIDGTNNGVINSYIQCSRGEGTAPGEAVCIGSDSAAGLLISNNHILGSGIPLFFTSSSSTTSRPVDVTMVRNLVKGDERQRKGGPLSDGFYYTLRQPWETKGLLRGRINGNIFENWWSDQINPAMVFVISIRGCDARVLTDLEFGYNFLRGTTSGFITAEGNNDVANCEPWPAQRIWVHDNVQVQSSNKLFCTGGLYCDTIYRAPWLRTGGIEDMIFERNTHWDPDYNTGNGGRFINFTEYPMGDPVFRDNLGVFQNDGGGQGGCTYNATTGGPWPDGTVPTTCIGKINEMWSRPTFTGNVIRAKSPSTTTSVDAEFTGTNTLSVSSLANVGFGGGALTSTLSRDFRLNEFTSTYRSSASDGRAPGASWIRLQEEIGGVQNFSVQQINATSIVVGFSAYGGLTTPGTACKVDANTSATFANAPTRVTASVNSTMFAYQTATITGLTTGTDYYIRVHCGGEPFVYGGEAAPTAVRTR